MAYPASGVVSFGYSTMKKTSRREKKQKSRFWVQTIFSEEKKEQGKWQNLF